MRAARPRLLPALFLALAAALAACAPRVEGLGPTTQAPAFGSTAFVMADGYALPYRMWGPQEAPRAVILGLHGFNDYSGFLANAGPVWAERGVLTLAYDQRGFGATAGRGLWHGDAALVRDARTAIDLVRRRWPDAPLVLLGESMGGAVALAALGEGPGGGGGRAVDGAVLSAPAAAEWEAFPWWQRAALWTAAHTVPWMTATGRGLKRRPSDNLEMLKALAQDPLVIKETRLDAVWGLIRLGDRAHAAAAGLPPPALVLWGEKEELIPARAQTALDARLPAAVERRRYPDGHHMLTRDLNAARVLEEIADWTLARRGGD
ncbi:MAG: lysophospholipase [Alphaproteobacteria bacterium]|nr:lysophospholipase [Alphaproteobacteria bacterium]